MAGFIGTPSRTDWNTPEFIVEGVWDTFGGPPDLDPCSNENSIVGANKSFILPQDGLREDWSQYKNIYVNPPFGRDKERKTSIYDWVEKSNDYIKSKNNLIYLTPAAIDTNYWHHFMFWKDRNYWMTCFFKGRLKFLGAKASAPMPCALTLFSWGKDHAMMDRFYDYFKKYGFIFD